MPGYTRIAGPIGINADNFMDILDTGVHVCQLAQLIGKKATAAAVAAADSYVVVPDSAQVAKVLSRFY